MGWDVVSPTPALQHRLSMTNKREKVRRHQNQNLKSNILPVGFCVVLLLFNRLPHLSFVKQRQLLKATMNKWKNFNQTALNFQTCQTESELSCCALCLRAFCVSQIQARRLPAQLPALCSVRFWLCARKQSHVPEGLRWTHRWDKRTGSGGCGPFYSLTCQLTDNDKRRMLVLFLCHVNITYII